MSEDVAWQEALRCACSGHEDQFEVALHCCPLVSRGVVFAAEGEYFRRIGDHDRAAVAFAQSNLSFDDVVLRLLNGGRHDQEQNRGDDDFGESDNEDEVEERAEQKSVGLSFPVLAPGSGPELSAIRRYLEEVLRFLPLTSKSQRTMVCTWLCELFVHEITACTLDKSLRLHGDVMNRFQGFLRTHKGSLDPTITMQLIASRDVRPLVVFYAQIVGDYEKVVYFYLNDRRYADVVSLLTDAPFEKVELLIYQASPVLIEWEPEAVVNLFLAKPRLQLSRLLPTLLRYCERVDSCDANDASLETDYDGRHINFAVHYIESCLSRDDYDSATRRELTQLYFYLLAKYDDVDERKLLALIRPILERLPVEMDDEDIRIKRHVARYNGTGDDLGYDATIPFDVGYALNICSFHNRLRSTVLLLYLSGSNEESLTRAVHVDLEIAKLLAFRPASLSQRKKLWGYIVRESVIGLSENDRNSLVLSLLRDSEGVLQVEDVLKYLSNPNDVDAFREEICRTLESFGEKIECLRAEMEELADSTESIVAEIETTKKQGYGFSTTQKCEYCSDIVFSRPFYMFPCSHGYHCDCVMKRLHEHLEPAQVEVVQALDSKLQVASKRAKDLDRRAILHQDYLQHEIDDFVAADCPLCGEAMIRSLALPLIPETEGMVNDKSFWAL